MTIYSDKVSTPLESENYMRGSMIHETGHTFSYQIWGTDQTKGIQVFGSTKGTPKFDEYKAMVPQRFAILAKELP